MGLRAVLFLLLALLSLSNLGLNDIWQPNEAFYAETSREILESGNWLNLTYNYEPRLEKPPMTYWLTALSYQLFGVGQWQTRLVPLLSTFATALLLLIYGRFIRSWRFGLTAALIFLSAIQVFALARYDSPEMPLTFFLSGAFITLHLYLERNSYSWLALSALFLSVAMLVKGIPFLALYLGGTGLYLLFRWFFKDISLKEALKTFLKISLWGAFASLPILGWYLYAYNHYGELFLKVFKEEVLHRALNPSKGWNFSFYFVVILWAFLPFSLHFYYSLIGLLLKLREYRGFLFPLSWFLTTLAAFTVAKGKIPVYILPAFPAMALMVARLDGVKHRAIAFLNYLLFFLLSAAFFLSLHFLEAINNFAFWSFFLLAFALWAVLSRYELMRNIIMSIPILHLFVFAVLSFVEKYRPYKEVVSSLKTQYGEKKFVCLGYFYKDFPFYWRGKVYIVKSLEELKSFNPKEVLLFSPKPLKGWKIVKKVELYTGSESRFLVFLKDIKKHRRFKEFYFLVR